MMCNTTTLTATPEGDLKIYGNSYFKNALYFTVGYNPQDRLAICTGPIAIHDIKNESNGVCFPIKKHQDEKLFNYINVLENDVRTLIKDNITGEQAELFPEPTSTIFMQNAMKTDWNPLRSNYRYDDPVLFLKGNKNSLKVKNADNEDFPLEKLTPGIYNFLIRASNVYIGPHGDDTDFICSLQLRIESLTFRPFQAVMEPQLTAEETSHPPPALMRQNAIFMPEGEEVVAGTSAGGATLPRRRHLTKYSAPGE